MSKRVKTSRCYKHLLVNILSKKLDDNSNYYYTVIELTQEQWNHMNANAIIFSDLVRDKSINNVYSDNIKKKLKRCKCT